MKNTSDYSSRFRILKGGKISLVVSAMLMSATLVHAAPTGGSVTTGSASINQAGSVTTITQSTNKASINWQDFSIGKNETVNFVQPSSSSVTLNRVVGTSASLIEGAMNANGQVFLLNPNGVLFSKDATVNVGGLVASTLNISDENFQAGNYTFEGNSQNSVLNMGTITTNNGGYVAMMGKTVKNEGTIVATMGNVQLAGGDKISLNLNGNSLVKLTIDEGTLNALVENKGLIKADGGQVYLTTQALNTILDGMVNNSGVIEAKTLNDVTGKVVLFAHDGTTNVSGTVDATGGFVETSGEVLHVSDGTIIKVKEWLLDPTNITIASSGTDTVTGSSISASTVQTALGNGNVLLEATNDININQALTWNANTLTLSAGHDINVNKVIDITGSGNITLTYSNKLRMQQGNDGLSFDGKINFSPTSTATTMTINGDTYQIIKSLSGWSTSSATLYGLKGVLATDLDAGQTALTTAELWQFDGLGHTISNLKYTANFVENDNKTSLFRGRLGQSGKQDMRLSNLGILNLDTNIPTSADTNGGVGGLVSSTTYNGDSTSVSSLFLFNVFTQGTITSGVVKTGGLVGNFTGSKLSIDESHSMVNITSTKDYVGGLFASGIGALVKNSYVKANITGEAYIGGIAGVASSADVQDSYVVGDVTANNASGVVGGFFGQFGRYFASSYTGSSYNNVSDTISDSYFAGTVTGTTKVGGIIGDAWTFTTIPAFTITLDNVQTYGQVIGTSSYLGGFVGELGSGSTITLTSSTAYNTTKQSASTASVELGVSTAFLGSLIGNTGTITNTNSTTGTKSFSYLGLSNFSKQAGQLSTSDLTPTVTGTTPTLGTHYKTQILSDNTVVYDSATDGASVLTALGTGTYTVKYVDLNQGSFKLAGLTNTATLTVTASNGSSSTPEPTPTVDQEQTIGNVVTTVKNNSVMKHSHQETMLVSTFTPEQITPEYVSALSTLIQETIGKNGTFELVSAIEGGTFVESLTLDQLEKKAKRTSASTSSVSEIRIPLAKNSLVDLVNGGVKLPTGISQQFFVVKGN